MTENVLGYVTELNAAEFFVCFAKRTYSKINYRKTPCDEITNIHNGTTFD